jgi:HEAT repeat protein
MSRERAIVGSLVLSALLVLILVPPPAIGQDAHPNDDKVVFFKKPDKATFALLEDAVTNRFRELLPSGRAEARQICYDHPLWSVPFLREIVEGRKVKSRDIQRWNAILTLARLDNPGGVRVVQVAAEKDKNLQVRVFACLALGLQVDPASVKILIRILKREKAKDMITAAALGLGRIGGSEAEAALHDLYRRDKSGGRGAALVALGLFPSGETMELARKALKDSKTGITWRAVLALANAAFGPRAERLAELKKIFEKKSNDRKVRALALLALARFTDYRGGSILLMSALNDRESEVVAAAARALQHRADPRTRKAIYACLRRVVDGEARTAARLLIALSDIEAANPTEDGLNSLLGLLGRHADAISIYSALALTRVREGWREHPAILKKTVRRLREIIRSEALGDEERASYRLALALLDPENAPENAPDAWATTWGDEDTVLPTIDETLHEAFLDVTNWFVEEELGIHTLTDRPKSRRDLASGTARVMEDENQPLHDLREWLKEVPYVTEGQLPDRGYRE